MAGRFWKEAATLIVVARNSFYAVKKSNFETDYRVLFLKRSKKSKFMPEAYVFPGGVLDEADHSLHWMDIFRSCGHQSHQLKETFGHAVARPALYTGNDDKPVLPELAFRICAIRETFEETGLLLTSDGVLSSVENSTLNTWKARVHEDAGQFLQLFCEYGCCPDVWSLYEWSCWLTPAESFTKRFDTAFYVAFVDKLPAVTYEKEEAEDIKVVGPSKPITQFLQGNIWMAPPQVYELCRLLQFSEYEALANFTKRRMSSGMIQFFPIRFKADDGYISALPGDDLYPEEPDLFGTCKDLKELKGTVAELRKMSRNLHRFETIDFFPHPRMNIKPIGNHIPPKDFIDALRNTL